jgi:transposase InsO family protein
MCGLIGSRPAFSRRRCSISATPPPVIRYPELVYRTSWRTREQAENALFAYIDGWYNRERIQARLGWQSPDEYERTWHTSGAHPEPAPTR